MANKPPKTTIVIENVPEEFLIGVDFQFFNTTAGFRGIKLCPSGVHILHWSANQESQRFGTLIEASEGKVILAKWNREEEKMELEGCGIGELDISAMYSRLGENYQWMVNWPDTNNWNLFVEYIDKDLVNSMPLIINTSSGTKDENDMLRETLNSQGAKSENIVVEEDELMFSKISKRTWPEGSESREITDYSRDKTWYLNNQLGGVKRVIGELQLSFVFIIALANFSAAQQYLKILELLMNCETQVDNTPQLYKKIFEILNIHFTTCPDEIFDMFFGSCKLGEIFSGYHVHHNIPTELINLLESKNISIETEDDDPVIV